jgi:hypothetical protein
MEDLVPLIFFLVIVAVNGLKFLIERGAKKRTASPSRQPEEEPARNTPPSIENFFENIAEQLAPKPREVPDWPENIERPDYIQEMTEFEHDQAEELWEEQTAEIIPMPVQEPVIQKAAEAAQPVQVQLPVQSIQTAFSGSHGIRIPGMNSFIQSGAIGNSDFRISGKQDLKRAILAHVIFSAPRAFDLSYDNTIAK